MSDELRFVVARRFLEKPIMRNRRTVFCFKILLPALILVYGSTWAFGQGGTGKMPPPNRNPNGRPPPRTPPVSEPEIDYVISVDNAALNNGRVAGDILYRGPAPRRLRIDTSADSGCPRLEIDEPLVSRGKLGNVFVYLKDGVTADGKKLSELSFPIPDNEAVLAHIRCNFMPHVLGVMVNQNLVIRNGDPTTHNTHFAGRNNAEWNQSQSVGASPITHRFDRLEIMVRVKDNQHPWEKAFIGVLNHPFFAVTGAEGKFEIRGVPPGKYTLATWFERDGRVMETTRKVTIRAAP